MNIINNNKKFLILYGILIIIGIIGIVFTYNNYSYYKDTIVRIIEIDNKYVSTDVSNYGYKDEIYKQTIKAKVLNGADKNKIVNIENEYHKGEAYDQKYKKGDELFVSLYKTNKQVDRATIDGYKRDKYIVILIVFFVLVIVLIGKIKGFLSIISLFINIVVFSLIVRINAISSANLVLLCFIGAIIFSTISLFLVSGVNKKSFAAVVSSILGIIFVTIISFIVIKLTNYEGIRFEQMELLTRPYEGIFISEILLGGLGAIMDISISISSSLNEMIEKNKKISVKTLKTSGFNIGKDIMSTMINVLFFTYLCTGIVNLTIYFRNGISIGSLLREYISLEMTRALTGAIGIVITIPIAIYITLFLYKRRVK